MPTHGGEQWIDAALHSIAAEATNGIEVLVLDSSPTSTTLDIARRYSDVLRLRLFGRCDPCLWHAKTNRAVQIATSSHICWLHQDDLWLPGRSGAVRRWIEATPMAPLHLAPTTIIDRVGLTLGTWRCPLPIGELRTALVMQRLLVQNFVAAPAPVFRKDAWLAAGGLDEQLWYTADWDIWLKLAASGPTFYHDQLTTAFRIHDGSLTMIGSRDVADFSKQMQIVLERHLPRLRDDKDAVGRVARASIAVNAALAHASAGNFGSLSQAVFELVRLGPVGLHRYLRDSRIVERLAPRVRAKLSGAF
jgi:glycosyltransferase involved in cell wall biosynthesis